MANKRTIRQMLDKIAANYSKPPEWAADNEQTWLAALDKFSDQLVVVAVKRWISENSRTPNVANIRGTIEGMPTRGEPDKPEGCRRCAYGGQVEIAHHVSDKNGGPARCILYAAACNCPAGQRLAVGPFMPWDLVVDQMRADPFTLAVYHSTPEQPHLTEYQRNSAEDLERREQMARDMVNRGPVIKPIDQR